jgi:hypothetical protein
MHGKSNKNEDDEIEEDIMYDGKFDNADDIDSENDDFVESISKTTSNTLSRKEHR